MPPQLSSKGQDILEDNCFIQISTGLVSSNALGGSSYNEGFVAAQ